MMRKNVWHLITSSIHRIYGTKYSCYCQIFKRTSLLLNTYLFRFFFFCRWAQEKEAFYISWTRLVECVSSYHSSCGFRLFRLYTFQQPDVMESRHKAFDRRISIGFTFLVVVVVVRNCPPQRKTCEISSVKLTTTWSIFGRTMETKRFC